MQSTGKISIFPKTQKRTRIKTVSFPGLNFTNTENKILKTLTQNNMNRFTLLSLLALGAFFASFGYAAEEASKLQATGVFVKNDKGALVFTDDADKKKYYGFNKGVKEKVGDLVGKKVKLNAKIKKKEGAKITLMTFVVSVKPVK
jgi:hypothetical protein